MNGTRTASSFISKPYTTYSLLTFSNTCYVRMFIRKCVRNIAERAFLSRGATYMGSATTGAPTLCIYFLNFILVRISMREPRINNESECCEILKSTLFPLLNGGGEAYTITCFGAGDENDSFFPAFRRACAWVL